MRKILFNRPVLAWALYDWANSAFALTVMAGFSVLAFSNFVPTVMFGIWTAVAMALALLANLTLLPALLVLTHASSHQEPTLRAESDEDP